jgi:regulator of cell morphogenesis and NO signaling
MIETLESTTIGDIVAADFRTAAVFERFGIDFCCGGRRSVAEACRSVAADPGEVIAALSTLPQDLAEDDTSRWPVNRLIDHIVATHHGYVRRALPAISRHLAKLHEVHGERHPELSRVADVWREAAAELTQHMMKEEQVLFPYIRVLAARDPRRPGVLSCPFGTVENPIRMMEREHQDAGDALRVIRTLTDDYTPPADGCTTYRVCMAELAAFEQDLHRHVHLENNVLFPRAVALEQRSWIHD